MSESKYVTSEASREILTRFAASIRSAIDARKWTQHDLARESSVPLRTIQNILGTRHAPSLLGAAHIAKALGTTVDHLCGLPEAVSIVGATLFCIHVDDHLPGQQVCLACHTIWYDIQKAKNESYSDDRIDHHTLHPDVKRID